MRFQKKSLLLLVILSFVACSLPDDTERLVVQSSNQTAEPVFLIVSSHWENRFDLRYKYEISNSGPGSICLAQTGGHISGNQTLEVVPNIFLEDDVPYLASGDSFAAAEASELNSNIVEITEGSSYQGEGWVIGDVIPVGTPGRSFEFSLTVTPVACHDSASSQAAFVPFSSNQIKLHLTEMHQAHEPAHQITNFTRRIH